MVGEMKKDGKQDQMDVRMLATSHGRYRRGWSVMGALNALK